MIFNISAFVTAFIAINVVLNLISAHPIQQDGLWVNPCSGSTRNDQYLLRISRHRHHTTEMYAYLKNETHVAASICNEISTILVPIIGASNANDLNSRHRLIGFPATGRLHIHPLNTHTLLWSYFDRLSRAGVFLELTLFDAMDHEDELLVKLEELNAKYRNILCDMQLMSNAEVTSDVTRDIIPNRYRSIDAYIHRHRRNYLIIRDVKNLFSSLSESIDRYLEDR